MKFIVILILGVLGLGVLVFGLLLCFGVIAVIVQTIGEIVLSLINRSSNATFSLRSPFYFKEKEPPYSKERKDAEFRYLDRR